VLSTDMYTHTLTMAEAGLGFDAVVVGEPLWAF
jgi:hypothetical protein